MRRKNTLLLLCILSTGLCFCSNRKQKKSIVWKETVGTLPFLGHGGQGQIDYEVNGKMYRSFFDHRNSDAKKDDKYTMRYNVDDPNEIEVDYWNPVFVPGEKTSHVVARIDKIQTKNFWREANSVTFSYHVNNALLQKYVYLPPDYLQKYPTLKVGQLYDAECWDEDVNRVVVHLNTLIAEKK